MPNSNAPGPTLTSVLMIQIALVQGMRGSALWVELFVCAPTQPLGPPPGCFIRIRVSPEETPDFKLLAAQNYSDSQTKQVLLPQR